MGSERGPRLPDRPQAWARRSEHDPGIPRRGWGGVGGGCHHGGVRIGSRHVSTASAAQGAGDWVFLL